MQCNLKLKLNYTQIISFSHETSPIPLTSDFCVCIFYFHIQPLPALNLDPSNSPSAPHPQESPHTNTSMINMTFLKMLLCKRWRSGFTSYQHFDLRRPLAKPPLKFFSVLPQGSVTLAPFLFFLQISNPCPQRNYLLTPTAQQKKRSFS